MGHGLKSGYFVFVAALITLPLSCFAKSNPSDNAMPRSSTRVKNKTDGESLSLSLSLFISSTSVHQTDKPADESNVAAWGELNREFLLMPLTYSLSLSSIHLAV
ncbi:MAG: hypothetical protein ABI363_00275, partial [Nitrosospira sp.]